VVEAFQKLLVGPHALAGLQDLGLLLKQEGAHVPFGQAAAEIEKGAVFLSFSAVTIEAATFEKALQKGGVNRVLREGERAQEMSLALAQGESGEALEFRLTHIMSKISQAQLQASEKENAC
jgi:hypothetical protein